MVKLRLLARLNQETSSLLHSFIQQLCIKYVCDQLPGSSRSCGTPASGQPAEPGRPSPTSPFCLLLLSPCGFCSLHLLFQKWVSTFKCDANVLEILILQGRKMMCLNRNNNSGNIYPSLILVASFGLPVAFLDINLFTFSNLQQQFVVLQGKTGSVLCKLPGAGRADLFFQEPWGCGGAGKDFGCATPEPGWAGTLPTARVGLVKDVINDDCDLGRATLKDDI